MPNSALLRPFGSLPAIPSKSWKGLGACFLSTLILAFLSSCMRMRSSSPIHDKVWKLVPAVYLNRTELPNFVVDGA